MNASLSLPDPGEFHRPLQNGHAPGLVSGPAIDDLAPFYPADDSVDSALATLDDADLRGDGVLPLHPTDVAEMLATPGFDLMPDVDEQTRALEAELCAELDRLDREGTDALDGSSYNLAHGKDDSSALLPGFEALTRADLDRSRQGLGNQVTCPVWCGYAGLPIHGDGFDSTPEAEVPHRGVPHDIPALHGGKSLDHAGRAEVSTQLEQERYLATGPVITLSVVVRGIEQYVWLTIAESRTLYRNLGQLLDDANGNG